MVKEKHKSFGMDKSRGGGDGERGGVIGGKIGLMGTIDQQPPAMLISRGGRGVGRRRGGLNIT